jgi:hypothetical protein
VAAADVGATIRVLHHNTDFGIYLQSGSGIAVGKNSISYNAREFVRAAAGVDVNGTDNSVFEFNISHHNGESNSATMRATTSS